MNPVKETLADSLTQPTLNLIGKMATITTIGVKSMAFVGLTQVNEVFTFIIGGITILYMTFKGLNEFNIWLDKRRKNRKK